MTTDKKRKRRHAAALLLWACLWPATATAQSRLDSMQHVEEVVVVASLARREAIPGHVMKGTTLERLNSHSIADALRFFSGLQLKDYGGVGGIKTVNIRSMGSNHLGIYYDGIQLGNAQNGQVDLGQFSMDNVEEITLYNGQKSSIFQPASEFGNAGSVYIRTRRPRFAEGESDHLKVKVKGGSSDMVRLSALWEHRVSSSVSSSVSAGLLNSSGKYKFRYRRFNPDGTTAYDTTAVRQNGDVLAARVEANVNGRMADGEWNVKAYTYHSNRGIPGAIVNNVWRRGERQTDHNSFVQAYANKNVGKKYGTRLLLKYAYYDTRYVNRDTTTMLVDNTFRQQEAFVSSSHVYEILPSWSVSAAYDFKWNKLDSDARLAAAPRRFANYLSVATAFNGARFNAQASLMAQWAKDHTKTMAARKSVKALTPAVFVNAYPFADRALSIRAFAKRSYRMPTFNDLYYTDMGNASLRPESALQYDIGATYAKERATGLLARASLQVDAYYNSVSDKIVAYPKGQQFRWTMLNLGKVHVRGIDVEAEAAVRPLKDTEAWLRLQYTYQDARDVTDPATSYYGDQIPYIPWHSGSAIIGARWRRWTLDYSFIYAGERYNQQENIRYNHMQPWYTSDMSLTYSGSMGRAAYKLTLEVNNLLSQDYDVILNYPMPKRNYAVSIDITI